MPYPHYADALDLADYVTAEPDVRFDHAEYLTEAAVTWCGRFAAVATVVADGYQACVFEDYALRHPLCVFEGGTFPTVGAALDVAEAVAVAYAHEAVVCGERTWGHLPT